MGFGAVQKIDENAMVRKTLWRACQWRLLRYGDL